MTQKDIEKTIAYIRVKIKELGVRPNQIILRADILCKAIAHHYNWSTKETNLILSVLIYSQFYLLLSEIGYSVINKEIPLRLKLNLNELLSIGIRVNNETVFYSLWEIIGSDQYENPFYVDGKTFYNTIKSFITDLPPTYSQFTTCIHESGKSTARSIWCKELFSSLSADEVRIFLQRLSDEVNKKLEKSTELAGNPIYPISEISNIQVVETSQQSISQPFMEKTKDKTPKIFISHNTADKDYAMALVTLMMGLGIDEEKYIFCSSVPGCGVEFGGNFIEAIKDQYENYNLIVLFIHSPRFYQSPVSLCEMGAAWILKNRYWSFLTYDCEFEMLKGVVPSNEMAFRAGQTDTYHLLNDFKDSIEKIFNLPIKNISRWEVIKTTFINAVSK